MDDRSNGCSVRIIQSGDNHIMKTHNTGVVETGFVAVQSCRDYIFYHATS